MTKYPIPLRLSFSSHNLLRECERKFELTRLIENGYAREESPIFSFGHSFGEGIAHYLLTGNLDESCFKAWNAYWPNLEDEQRSASIAVHCVESAKDKLDEVRDEFDVATFNGKPAIELGFRLNINQYVYFVGFLDAALRSKRDGHYAVWENKHTYSKLNDITPMYRNSGQAIGYSVILDAIAQQELAEYGVFYCVSQIKDKSQPITHVWEWEKTLLDRLNWFITLGMDSQHITALLTTGVFPQRGSSCLNYNRPCPFFGTCSLRAFDKPKTELPDPHVYDFEYALDDLVKQHLDRVRRDAGQETLVALVD